MKAFMDKVQQTDSCWLWMAGKFPSGYGVFRHERAHRFSYRLFRGEIPSGMIVMHKCDVRSCVNPDHLEAATQKDNIRDAMQKGRFKHNPHAKLTPQQCDEIVRSVRAGANTLQLAQQYGVHRTRIQQLARKKNG